MLRRKPIRDRPCLLDRRRNNGHAVARQRLARHGIARGSAPSSLQSPASPVSSRVVTKMARAPDRARPAPPGRRQFRAASPRLARHDNFRRPGQHVDGAIEGHQPLRRRHIQISRADDLVHARNRLRAIGQRGNRMRAAHAIELRRCPAGARQPASPAQASATPPRCAPRPPPAPESPSSAASKAADAARSAHSSPTESIGRTTLSHREPRAPAHPFHDPSASAASANARICRAAVGSASRSSRHRSPPTPLPSLPASLRKRAPIRAARRTSQHSANSAAIAASAAHPRQCAARPATPHPAPRRRALQLREQPLPAFRAPRPCVRISFIPSRSS